MAVLSFANDFAKLILEERSAEIEFDARVIWLGLFVLNYVRNARK